MIMMFSSRRPYEHLQAQISKAAPLDVSERTTPIVVLPVMAWTTVSRAGLHFALQICTEIHIVHVSTGDRDKEFLNNWRKVVEEPVRQAGLRMPQVKVLKSPYRFVIAPIVYYELDLERQNPCQSIPDFIPALIERHSHHNIPPPPPRLRPFTH